MAATKLKSRAIPVTARKRYRFLIEWAASGTSDALTVKAIWLDEAEVSITEDTIITKTARASHTWQVDSTHIIPPADARYLSISINKPNVATKFAIARVECKEHDNSLERVMREILLKDDFASGFHGELPWCRYDIAGTLAVTKVSPAPDRDNWSEFGVVRLSTSDAAAGEGGTIHLQKLCQGPPPVGTEFRIKVRSPDNTQCRSWAGVWNSYITSPDEAGSNVIRGIGFRLEPGASAENWFGICRNGTAESTVDIGVQGSSTWRDLGFYITPSGVQFTLDGIAVGAVVTTNLPSAAAELAPVIGQLTGTTVSKEMDIDIFALQTFLTR